MNTLQRLELRVLELHQSFNLRPHLDRAIELGDLLSEAKAQMKHGQWLPWLRRCGIGVRIAQMYMQAANAKARSHLTENMTLERFLSFIRKSQRHKISPAPDHTARLRADAQVHHADCRTFKGWPDSADVIATDPPWQEPEHYDWLAKFAADKLADGGLLLCQCGTADLADRVARLAKFGLRYRWTLAIVYADAHHVPPAYGFSSCWRPVLVMEKGRWQPGAVVSTDTFTVRYDSGRHKQFHPWQQPVDPWKHFIKRLTRPGAVILDPFCGSATNGVATLQAGEGRRYLGTEINKDAFRIARKRLAEHKIENG